MTQKLSLILGMGTSIFVGYMYILYNHKAPETPIETVQVCDINDASGCDDMITQNGSGWAIIDEQIKELRKKQGNLNKENNILRAIKELHNPTETGSIEKLK